MAADDTEQEDPEAGEYSLGMKAEAFYSSLTGRRQAVEDMARKMAEITLPFAFPPQGYVEGDQLPGNNQSVGAQCVNTLTSKLADVAFPPGHPCLKLLPEETDVQQAVDEDPEQWAETIKALTRLAITHTTAFYSIGMRSSYIEYIRQLLIAGNCLWKHLKWRSPTWHRMDTYVVQRSQTGLQLAIVQKTCVAVAGLDKDTKAFIEAKMQDTADPKESPASVASQWEQEVDIYCCQMYIPPESGDDETEGSFRYWEEYKGHYIPGTGVETDYDAPVMHAGWLIKSAGRNWSPSYCEMYQGDMYTVEAAASGLNDITAAAALALMFHRPGSQSSIKQVREARNLSILPGSAEDLTMFRSEKSADNNVVGGNLEQAARRLSAAFLMQSAIQRSGERVTAEEIQRLGTELDKALGGLYTNISDDNQKVIIVRGMVLNEERNPKLRLPKDKVTVQVITGIEQTGDSQEAQNLLDWGSVVSKMWGPEGIKQVDVNDFATRYGTYKGIKTDGLVRKPEQVAQNDQQGMQAGMMQEALSKGIGPGIKALADHRPTTENPTAAPPTQ
ncbi:portal protein [Mesorhizobium sp. WSM4982]|uniref:portal protein n=1 Tax=Mesorhizobium sp. WSM4982 TaxID=3038550 RepID=UPI00241561DF|nr:portal protein [Mesorhizobium sp. WSM4982]MDG4856423.1 portal protein [Mesorhizobium sp. WSM4982]